jgi:hypothetical protein
MNDEDQRVRKCGNRYLDGDKMIRRNEARRKGRKSGSD